MVFRSFSRLNLSLSFLCSSVYEALFALSFSFLSECFSSPSMLKLLRGRSRKIERGGSRCTQSVPSRTCPKPPGNFLHFLFSEVAFSVFSGKNSAQNLINCINFLTAIINSYQSCSNSNDPLNILHECCNTNLLMISFNYMSTKRGGSGPPGPPPPLDLPLLL